MGRRRFLAGADVWRREPFVSAKGPSAGVSSSVFEGAMMPRGTGRAAEINGGGGCVCGAAERGGRLDVS